MGIIFVQLGIGTFCSERKRCFSYTGASYTRNSLVSHDVSISFDGPPYHTQCHPLVDPGWHGARAPHTLNIFWHRAKISCRQRKRERVTSLPLLPPTGLDLDLDLGCLGRGVNKGSRVSVSFVLVIVQWRHLVPRVFVFLIRAERAQRVVLTKRCNVIGGVTKLASRAASVYKSLCCVAEHVVRSDARLLKRLMMKFSKSWSIQTRKFEHLFTACTETVADPNSHHAHQRSRTSRSQRTKVEFTCVWLC